ncbi:MAG: hypothetical protein A3J48_01180 [Candidatus Doudnabacteria bacterium RIFCSPHIGHO2_02_FULL_46_11]|uniref:Aspartyl/glutamyl-tRNA(Asn/Gln) amidotransferase subunit C n=1 Tax=Candidatus Doudnabacteria bacterium RIFCSPHIGHO2_02_FULL_46_11 TaxID=1817832 RepID=A0A1F5P4E8_9BACT|nr:MAG: hypothetical protein A3J48_01180 [Candidatus Doudnabacteria bacterium RIFCSPHIGHO2_02_FULL_46_11]
MAITLEEVRKVAVLARLKLTPEEEQKYAAELSSILDYVDQLKQVSAPTVGANLTVAHKQEELRPDETDGGRFQGEILKLAPTKKGDYLSVPAVFGEE